MTITEECTLRGSEKKEERNKRGGLQRPEPSFCSVANRDKRGGGGTTGHAVFKEKVSQT